MSNKGRIYLDYASTTPLDPRVKRAIILAEGAYWSNPSALYAEGVRAENQLDQARKSISDSLSAQKDEIIFTSGGTEANNLAIQGVLRGIVRAGKNLRHFHAITTNIEHSSVLNCFKEFEAMGLSVSYIPARPNGIIDPLAIKKTLQKNTILVSVMFANNEIGTIQPINEIARIIRHFLSSGRSVRSNLTESEIIKPIFHSDACQAPLYLKLSVNQLGVDLLSIDAHKIYGPKGVGALYVKRTIPIRPMMFGGGQEGGRRPTTENLPAIVGLAEALKLALERRGKESKRLLRLRDYFFSELEKAFPLAVINGDKTNRLPNNVNVSFPGFDAQELLIRLDALGVACSAKSSCLKDQSESYVIRALGGSADRASAALRFSLGRDTNRKSVDKTIQLLRDIVKY